MKKLLTLGVLSLSVLLAGCVNTNPTEEEIMEPVAEEVVAEVEVVAEEVAPVAEEVEVAPEAEEVEVMPEAEVVAE
jgi:outer membrane murein-binding lipoprotein Lpp